MKFDGGEYLLTSHSMLYGVEHASPSHPFVVNHREGGCSSGVRGRVRHRVTNYSVRVRVRVR